MQERAVSQRRMYIELLPSCAGLLDSCSQISCTGLIVVFFGDIAGQQGL